MERFCVFDIETVPLAEAETYVEPPKPRANLKDPAKIAADVAEKTAAILDRAALDPDLCRVVAVGWECDGVAESAIADNAEQERDLLERFWTVSRGATLVGFHCLGFDLPVLLRRSLYLGVAAPCFALNKYRPGAIVDLMQRLAYQGTLTYRSLSFYCTRFGIEVPDAVTGADIGRLVDAGEWRPVHDHVRADVAKTVALARRVGVIDHVEATPSPATGDEPTAVAARGHRSPATRVGPTSRVPNRCRSSSSAKRGGTASRRTSVGRTPSCGRDQGDGARWCSAERGVGSPAARCIIFSGGTVVAGGA